MYFTVLGYLNGHCFTTTTNTYLLCGNYSTDRLGFATLYEHPELPGAYIVVKFLPLEDTEHLDLKNSI